MRSHLRIEYKNTNQMRTRYEMHNVAQSWPLVCCHVMRFIFNSKGQRPVANMRWKPTKFGPSLL